LEQYRESNNDQTNKSKISRYFSSFLAGRIIDTFGVELFVFSNLSKYGVFVNDSIIDLIKYIQAPQIPINIDAMIYVKISITTSNIIPRFLF